MVAAKTHAKRKTVSVQHLLLRNATWRFYLKTLEQVAGTKLRINYFEGDMEIYSVQSLETASERELEQQHLVLENVSWDYYQNVLEQFHSSRVIKVSYFDGRMEIVSPLPGHERLGAATAKVIWALCDARDIDAKAFGSTTFYAKSLRAGVEPDECFYLTNIDKVLDMEKFDAEKYPPPDLAVEVEVTTRVHSRLPIYAALGIPELWIWSRDKKLRFYRLRKGKYTLSKRSIFLAPSTSGAIEMWTLRLANARNERSVLKAFRESLHP